jgi:hypothetical protein
MNRSIARAVVGMSFVGVLVLVSCTSAAPAQSPAPQATAPQTTFNPPAPPSVITANEPTLDPSATPEPPTAWDAEIAKVDENGQRPLDSALRLFAMAFGPLPGVDAPPPGEPIGSASPAVRAIRAHRAELTDEQRAAVDAYLAVPADAKTIDIVPAATGHGASRLAIGWLPILAAGYPYTKLEEEIAQEGKQAAVTAAYYYGQIPKLQVRLYNFGPDSAMTFYNPTFEGNDLKGCDVFVNTTAGNVDRFLTRRALTFDVVHCFQTNVMGFEAAPNEVPAWAWEGAAEYVYGATFPHQMADFEAWQGYLLAPDDPLFERVYDAVGYYAQINWNGIDLPAAMKAVLTDVDNRVRFSLAGTDSPGFLNNWASQLARQNWGHDWDFAADGYIPDAAVRAPRKSLSIANGSVEPLSQPAYTNGVYALQASAELVNFSYAGKGRLSDGAVNVTNLAGAWFCTTNEACGPCPDGKPLPFTPTRIEANTSLVGVSGGVDGTGGSVSGHSKEEFCKATPSPTATDDAFCAKYRSYVDWAMAQGGDISVPIAREIATRFIDMRGVAPDELVSDVDVMISVYKAYGYVDDPYNVPAAGQSGAQFIPDALKEMNAYCDVSMPGL